MKPVPFVTLIGAAALLSACATTSKPERVVVTQEVAKPVAVSCVPKSLGPAPSYPDTDDALKAAGPERFLQLLLSGRDLRTARLAQTEPAIEGCRQPAE